MAAGSRDVQKLRVDGRRRVPAERLRACAAGHFRPRLDGGTAIGARFIGRTERYCCMLHGLGADFSFLWVPVPFILLASF